MNVLRNKENLSLADFEVFNLSVIEFIRFVIFLGYPALLLSKHKVVLVQISVTEY